MDEVQTPKRESHIVVGSESKKAIDRPQGIRNLLDSNNLDAQYEHALSEQRLKEVRGEIDQHASVEQQGEMIVDRVFSELKLQESRQPHPEDNISISNLEPDDPEYAYLFAHGISEKTLKSGVITREALVKSGYVFKNTIGDDKKPKALLSGEFPDPKNPNRILDFTDRIFLTREELDTAYEYQQQHPELYGLAGHEIEDIRKDMFLFINSAAHRPMFDGISEFTMRAMPREGYKRALTGTKKDWEVIPAYLTMLGEKYIEEHPMEEIDVTSAAQKVFTEEYCKDIYKWGEHSPYLGIKEARGHWIKAIASRTNKLDGTASPFLEGGFYFGSNQNPDVEVEISGIDPLTDSEKVLNMRINMVSIHLLGGHPKYPGLCEMGGGS